MKNVMFLSASIAIVASIASGVSRAEEAAADTSGACFNEGIYVKGAVVDYDTKITGDGATSSFRTVNTVKANKNFEGVSAIPVQSETFNAKGKSLGVVTGYYDINPGFLLIFGTEAKGSKTTFDPAGSQPIDQKEGETYKQKYNMTTTAKGVGSQTTSRQASWKFVGVEELKLKLGKFKVCKITAKFTDKFSVFTTVTNQTIYVAAEGKYRGFALRTKTAGKLPTGQPFNTTADVIKFRKFQPK